MSLRFYRGSLLSTCNIIRQNVVRFKSKSSKLWANPAKIKPASQVKFMKKNLESNKSNKKHYYEDKTVFKFSLQAAIKTNELKTKVPRRVTVLGKLFMTNISDVLLTQSFSEFLLGKGFEITGVRVTKDYHYVQVFWYSLDNEKEEITKILDREAPNLRHQLTQLRLMGVVPRVVFFRDEEKEKFQKVQELISIADCGNESESEIESNASEVEEPIPVMTHNIFGLDRSKLVDKIIKLKQQAKAPHRLKVEHEVIQTKI